MRTYRADSDIHLEIPYVDEFGNTLFPDTVNYRLLDSAGTELIASTPLTIEGDDQVAKIVIAAAYNGLTGVSRDIRVVELSITSPEGPALVLFRYMIADGDGLVVRENTFMLFNEAILVGFDIPNTPSWDVGANQERTAALKEAYSSVGMLQYLLPETSLGTFEIADLTTEQWDTLPADFLAALKKAQLVESDYIMGGDWIADKRKAGLLSETIGESSNMFRSGKPLDLIVSPRAFKYLGKYVDFRRKLGRG